MGWDIFISHASEDKPTVAVPLKAALEAVGISVWIDLDQIKLGDSFRSAIDLGLQRCRFGVVILSPRFFYSKSEPLPQNPMEMSFGGLSADQIAEMRARRILLNQPPPHVPGDSELAFLNRSLLDIFVSGTDGPLQVKESSIPKLFQRFSSNPDLFVTLAKLTSVMLLQLSHTVEQVLRLEMRLEGNVLHIVFAGRRARRYMNVDPHIMHLSGTLDLLKG